MKVTDFYCSFRRFGVNISNMKTKNFFIAIFVLLILSFTVFAQTDEDKNWLSNIYAPYLPGDFIFYEYEHYTKEDVAKAKEKLNLIEKSSPKDEWDGTYSDNSGIGIGLIVWNSNGGFINFRYYHWLETLDYGKISASNDVVNLISEKPSLGRLSRSAPKRLIKVKHGERHYLVPESYIKEFCEEAVGLRAGIADVSNYWTKQGDYEKPVFGMPIVPAKYKNFIRQPIEAKIIKTGERKMVNDYGEEIHYYVTINIGKNKLIEPEMDVYSADLGEWIELKTVFKNISVGIIRRRWGEDKHEECWDGRKGSGENILCKEIKVGMKVFAKYG